MRLAEQAATGIRTSFSGHGLADPLDPDALTRIRMHTVTALVDWWLRHPGQSAAEMTDRSRRLLGAIRSL
ncbi:hypothetical protein [Sciscionella sediminilitoris]|uniref:hypothetical protein n=1 Tax=Sciscionella sediminilitoris TaxID=1445613 RepID=UPI0004DEE1F6|nr:hypothetical protein [Sciscionella sp. SE31]